MKKITFFIIIAIMISTVLTSSDVKTFNNENKLNILYLQSYNSYFYDMMNERKEEIHKIFKKNYNVSSMIFPSEIINNKDKKIKIYNTLEMHSKSKNTYSALIVSGNDALKFILECRDKIFKDIPIIFFAIDDYDLVEYALSYDLVSGIESNKSIDSNIDLILNNHKNIKNIHIISGYKSHFNKETIIYDENKYIDKDLNINFIVTSEMSSNEFSELVSTFDDDDAIIKVAPGDCTDVFFDINNFAKFIDSFTDNIPIYNTYEAGMTHENIGGKVVSITNYATTSMDMIDYILKNDYNENIYIDSDDANSYIFNNNALKKFDIKRSQLPKEAYILGSFHDILNKYGKIIYDIVIFIVTLIIIIFIMIYYIMYKSRYEKALIHTIEASKEANRLKSHFISNISHELRTPLNVIMSVIQLMKHKSYNYNNMFGDKLDLIDANCNRLLRLMNNLLDIEKFEVGNISLDLKNVNIVEFIETIIVSTIPLVTSKDLSIVFDTTDEEIIMSVDTDKIERVVLNLISNAIKFSKINGVINVNIIKNNDNLRIIVKDSGIGIPEENINKIFNRFVQLDSTITRRNEGSGIGLTIVKSFVKAHNGHITVISKVDEGTEFILDIPIITSNNKIVEYNSSDLSVSRVNSDIELSDIYV